MLFDIVYSSNKKLNCTLLERKEILEKIIPDDGLITKVKWLLGNGIAYFDQIKSHDLEGVVLKNTSSKYQINKRSNNWLKVINYKYENVYITGLCKDKFGMLLSYENGNYAGLMEFMPTSNRKEFYSVYQDYISSENDKFIYLDTKIKAKVKFRNYTSKGLLRIPSFVEWVS